MLGFVANSDWALRLVIWIGAGAVALAVLLLLQLLGLRALLLARQRRRERFLAVWKPLLMQSLEAVPERVPRIERADEFTFLSLWNYLHESLLDESKDKLNQLARLAGMDRVAQRMLQQRSVRQRLMAIATLGHLREAARWDELRQLASAGNPMLSLAAAKALVQINARAAIPWLIPLIEARTDWPVARVANLLKEAGADVVSQPLAQAALAASSENAPRIIRYLEMAHSSAAVPTLRRILHTAQDERVIRACLQLINDPGEVAIVRAYLDHPQWYIKLQAATTLGRIGTEEDEPRLAGLLGHPEWWVRYRAAQALASLPSVTLMKLKRLAEKQTNPFARDMLSQVIAEQQIVERSAG